MSRKVIEELALGIAKVNETIDVFVSKVPVAQQDTVRILLRALIEQVRAQEQLLAVDALKTQWPGAASFLLTRLEEK